MNQTTAETRVPVTPKPRLRKFHIGTGQSDREIIDQFVVRQSELERILEVLEGNIDSDSCQHLLLVAPRGRGKTTLLVRVIAELRTNPDFAGRLLPVRLMEESQEIFTLADFWLECLYFLAKACAPINETIADELRASHASLTDQWTDPALEGRARATVLDAADRLGRKLVIMIENLQALSKDAESDFGWDLRQVLQSEPQVMLLATATSRFAALEDAEEPFFELFRTLCLPALDTEECRRLWQAISGERVDARRIRPLRILTGGSPRLLVVLAGFSRERSLRQLMERLVELIDDHTEYFRSHIEDLAGSERRVYLALIDLWQESTSAEVAARARMEIRKVSAFLGRLVERGAVVAEGSGRNRTYYAAERLYSIYYKLRRDRDEAAVVRNLIHFMVNYYQGDELTDLSRQLLIEADQSDGIRQGLTRAAKEVPELRSLMEAQGTALPRIAEESVGTASPEAITQIRRHFEAGEFEAVIRLTDSLISEGSTYSIDDSGMRAMALNAKGDAQVQLFCEWARAIARAGLAHTLVQEGLRQDKLGDSLAAIATFDAVVERFGQSTERQVQSTVAVALLKRGMVQDRLGESAAAIASYDVLLARFGDSAEPELQVQVAWALVNKGATQRQLGDSAVAIKSYDALLARFGDSAEPELQVQVAWALVNKGATQGQLGDSAAAIESYDALLARFGDSAEPELQVQVAWALVNKGVTQGQLGDSAAAIESYDALLARFGDSAEPQLQVQVALALFNKGVTQGQLGDLAAAIESYDALLARFGDSADQQLLHAVALAIRNAGETLCMLGDADGAMRRAEALRALAGRRQSAAPLSGGDWLEAMASALLGEATRVEQLFRGILSRFDQDDAAMLRAFQEDVPTLVALGAEPGSLAGVLEEHPDALEALRPLAVALRLEAGDKVRAPSEMLEVAEDIRAAIQEKRRQRAC